MSMKRLSTHTVATGLIKFQLVVLFLVAFLTLYFFRSEHFQDLRLYYTSALDLIQGRLPYRDFPLEYPPLALLPIVLPQLINPFGSRGYVVLFFIENALFSIVLAWLLLPITHSLRVRYRSRFVSVAYVALVTILAPLLPWRYDLFPALLTGLALLSVIINRPMLVGFWLGLGIAAKLYPVILLPIFSLYYLVKQQYLALVRLLLGTFVTTCLILLPFALVGKEQFLSFVQYQQLRGLQLESIPAGVILLADKLGWTKVQLINNYGATHLISPLADGVLKWLPFTFLFLFGVVIISCLNCFRRERAMLGTVTIESLVTYIAATLLIFIATNKVFSPQYLIWLLPFAPLLRPRQIALFLGICIITIFIFPFFYWKLMGLGRILILVLNLRNVLLVTLMLWLIVKPSSVLSDSALIKSRIRHRNRALGS